MDDAVEPVIAFASMAARTGWSRTTLDHFCAAHGISEEERLQRWPSGVRSLGRQFNQHADAATLAHFDRAGPLPLSEVMRRRFDDNEHLKRAVRSLAWSDARHPLDTLARTARTAELMWRCQDRPLRASSVFYPLRVWALVVLYSACVMIWLGGRDSTLRAAVRVSARALGAH